MKLISASWLDNGKAAQRSFPTLKEAVEFSRDRAKSPSCGPVALWRYEAKSPAALLLMQAHDGSKWWDERLYVGCVLKNGKFTSR